MLRLISIVFASITAAIWLTLSPVAHASDTGKEVRIEILFSQDMANRANGRAKKTPAHLRAGSSNARITDFYGEKPLQNLAKTLRYDLTKSMEEEGITINPDSSNVLWVTIVDAIPNEWTNNQIKKMGAAFGGSGIGGAAVVGHYYDASTPDTPLVIPHKFYTGEANTMSRGWHDAERAIQGFSVKAAKTVDKVMPE